MNDRDFILDMRDRCNAQLAGTQPPVIPPGQPPTQPPTGTPPAADFNLGWSNGNPLFAQSATQSFSVTPSAEWLAMAASNAAYLAEHGSFPARNPPPIATLSVQGGYNPQAGVTPPWVRYTIGGTSLTFVGSNQNWSFDPSFPNGFPMPTGPFNVLVELLDDLKQPVGAGFGVAISLNHTP